MLIVAAGCLYARPAAGQSDDRAREIVARSIERMGGMEAWNQKRYMVWQIFGENHYWDKWSGDFRWEMDSVTVLMNLNSKSGGAWIEGSEVREPAAKGQLLDRAYQRWVNNSYWTIMPLKLLDPGVNLRYVGVDTSEAGQASDVIELTFDSVGLTPNNRYRVMIDRTTGMVCQWSYYRQREDETPRFTRPWTDWKEYNGIWMSTGRGEDHGGVISLALPDKIPSSVFTDPKPVAWRP